MRKSIFFLVVCLIFFSLVSIYAYAHSGKTDGSGGHYDHSTGDYHYHHGKAAHYHPNGVCPYSSSAETQGQDDTIWGVVLISSAAAWLCGLIFKERADFMWLIYTIGIIGMIVSVIAFIV